DWPHPPGRLTASDLSAGGWPPEFEPTCYVCGPTGFVETAAGLLVALGHHPGRIRTERFGPSGRGPAVRPAAPARHVPLQGTTRPVPSRGRWRMPDYAHT